MSTAAAPPNQRRAPKPIRVHADLTLTTDDATVRVVGDGDRVTVAADSLADARKAKGAMTAMLAHLGGQSGSVDVTAVGRQLRTVGLTAEIAVAGQLIARLGKDARRGPVNDLIASLGGVRGAEVSLRGLLRAWKKR